MPSDDPRRVGLVPVATLVLWLGCAAVGAAGLVLRYPREKPRAKELGPVQAQRIDVDVTDAHSPAAPPPEVGSPSAPAPAPMAVAPAPPPVPQAPAAPAAPPLAP